MASTISAGTTAGTAIAIAGDTTGNLAFQTSAGTYTQTMPNATGTVMVSGNMPAFSAWNSNATSVANVTATKIAFDTEEFDTANCFASSRFTPNVAGYYQINGNVIFGAAGAAIFTMIYKNGSAYKRGSQSGSASASGQGSYVSALVYMNGSTDYVEIYAYQSTGGSNSTSNDQVNTWFSGCLIRGA
jgi:hypothetical protein